MSSKLQQFTGTNARSNLLLGFIAVIMAVFVVRLFYLQVIQHDYYVNRAYQTQVSKLTITPERGQIYAMDGTNTVPLVLNETVYTAFADPQEVTNSEKIIAAFRDIAGGNLVDNYEDKLDSKKLRYVPIAKQLTRLQADLIKKKNLAGVGLQKGTRRVYPEASLAGQTLGYVNGEGAGQYGLEEALDARLKGLPGALHTVTDVRQIPLTIGQNDVRQDAVDGDDLVLTIDRNIQLKTEQVLRKGLESAKATKGSVLVMDPSTGAVLAMANFPTYDPGKYTDVAAKDYGVFQNGIVSDPFEAGSVIKTLTMGAGLDSGAVNVGSLFDNTGQVQVDDTTIKNVEEDPIYPNTSMTDVLQYSLNTGVVYILEQMGGGTVNKAAREKLHQYFVDRYRFGRPTGIEQAGEAKGIIIGANEGDGKNVRYANMTFGQGMNVTMIQTAAAFSATVNGGTYYQPHVVKGTRDETGDIKANAPTVVASNVLSPKTSADLTEMIYQGRHKGFFGKFDPAGYRVGGKTGTSQVIDPKTGKYSDDNSIGSYLGFGGSDSPRYVIMVRVEDSKLKSGYAGTVAAGPIFNELSNWMLSYLEIKPRI